MSSKVDVCATCGCSNNRQPRAAASAASTSSSPSTQAFNCLACRHDHGAAPDRSAEEAIAPVLFEIGRKPKKRALLEGWEAQFSAAVRASYERGLTETQGAETVVEHETGEQSGAKGEEESSDVAAAETSVILTPHNSYDRMAAYTLARRFGMTWVDVRSWPEKRLRTMRCGCCEEEVTVTVRELEFRATSESILPLLPLQAFWGKMSATLSLKDNVYVQFVGLDARQADKEKAQQQLARADGSVEPSPAAPEMDRDALSQIFTFLPPKTVLFDCALVCRAWHAASKADAVWTRTANLLPLSASATSMSQQGYSSVRQWFLDHVANNRIEHIPAELRANGKKRRRLRIQLLREALLDGGLDEQALRYVEDSSYVKSEIDYAAPSATVVAAADVFLAKAPQPGSVAPPTTDPFARSPPASPAADKGHEADSNE
jgi:F-box-like